MHAFARLSRADRPLLLLAPLASLSHRPLRELIHRHGGCDLYFTEMISAEALVHGSPYREYYLDAAPAPERTVFQLVGSDGAAIAQACALLRRRFDAQEQSDGRPAWAGIDLNMGCSAPEIVRRGAGADWLRRPADAVELAAAVRPLVDAGHSLSVKLRIGESEDFPALVRLCRGLQDAGADFLTLHPRLRGDPWGRPARWSWFGALASELSIPLVANGDVKSAAALGELSEAWRAAGRPGAWPAGVMVGRAAVRAPWIFARLRAALDGDPAGGRGPHDLLAAARAFHELLERHQPADFWLTRGKRFYAYFCTNMAYGNRLAASLQSCGRYPELFERFSAYLAENPGEGWREEA